MTPTSKYPVAQPQAEVAMDLPVPEAQEVQLVEKVTQVLHL